MRVKYQRSGDDTGDLSRTTTAISRIPAAVGSGGPVVSLPRSMPSASGTLALASGWTGRRGRFTNRSAFTLIEVIMCSGLTELTAASPPTPNAQGFAIAEVAR